MQFLQISPTTTLSQLSSAVKSRNVEQIIAANSLPRVPAIGAALKDVVTAAAKGADPLSNQRKATLLNKFAGDSDLFEKTALLGEAGWHVLDKLGTFANTLIVPESITLPTSSSVLGNGQGVSKLVYQAAMGQIQKSGTIDPAVFNEFSTRKYTSVDYGSVPGGDTFQWFNIPWGQITLYSSLGGDSMDFPVYPEELSDKRSATYEQMPDMLYQYEPWQLYKSSGPRGNDYTFKFHRDMWTGDHRDGKANKLIRFCEANCYPRYSGSAVNTSTVTLYVAGKELISGVVNDVSTEWDGPIGQDGWYLHCTLKLSIVEVSKTALNYDSVRNKGLIG